MQGFHHIICISGIIDVTNTTAYAYVDYPNIDWEGTRP